MRDILFAQLVEDAQTCRKCPRMEGRRRVLSADNGVLSAALVFVAEAPGRLGGDRGGIPLSGDASGRNFGRYLAAAGLARANVFVTNAALCNPRTMHGTNAPPSAGEVRACSPFLRRTLAIVAPRVVVTLGAKALSALGLIAPHEIVLSRDAVTAIAWNGMTVFPLYHPSPQVAVSPTGRTHAAQENDYRALSRYLQKLTTGI